jgi:hypothetical protein
MNFLRRIWYSVRHRHIDDELAEEIESHRAMAQSRLEQEGLPAADAAAESQRLMGNLTLAREDARAERVAPWLDGAWQDLRYGIRSAAHEPGFAVVAIATLAAAIGLNTTLFTIFNAVALAPWPVADAVHVVTIHNTSGADVRVRGGGAPGGFSLEEVDYFRANSRTLTVEPLIAAGQVALTSTPPLASGNIKGGFHLPGDSTDRFNSAYEVSPGYIELLQIPLVQGRTFRPTDADQDVIVINETMARQLWPAGSAVGQTIFVDQRTGGWNRPGELRVIGVVRDAAMTSLTTVEPTIYQPLSGRGLPQAIVRDGTAAQATVAQLAGSLEPRLSIRARSLSSNLSPQIRPSRIAAILSMLLSALALLLACVGMAGVFAYVVQQRTHEIGVHMALGARLSHIVGVVVRSSLLAIAGAAVVGLVGAFLASGMLRRYLFGLSAADPLAHVGVLVVLAVAGAAATFVPARNAARIEPVNALRHE